MKHISILKIITASLSLLIINYKKIITYSILPIILTLPLLVSMPEVIESIQQNGIKNVVIPANILLYGILFIYGYASININTYRMVTSGDSFIFKLGIIPAGISIKFILLSVFIGIFNIAPIILQIPFLEPVIFILLAGVVLNLVSIATENKATRWKLSIIDRLNIALLQFIIPTLIISVFSFFGNTMVIISKFLLVYWSAISLGLMFNQIKNSQVN